MISEPGGLHWQAKFNLRCDSEAGTRRGECGGGEIEERGECGRLAKGQFLNYFQASLNPRPNVYAAGPRTATLNLPSRYPARPVDSDWRRDAGALYQAAARRKWTYR